MEADIKCNVRPFNVPSYVYLDTGRQVNSNGNESEELKVPVSTVDVWTLDSLCTQFRRALFAKAGKQEPPTPIQA